MRGGPVAGRWVELLLRPSPIEAGSWWRWQAGPERPLTRLTEDAAVGLAMIQERCRSPDERAKRALNPWRRL